MPDQDATTYNFPKIHHAEGGAPATPDAGEVVTYAKADGLMYSMNDAGVETLMSGGPGGGAGGSLLPWTIDIDVYHLAILNTNFDTISGYNAGRWFGFCKVSSGAQNDEIGWDVVLAAGTWDFRLLARTSTDNGIYSVRLDGVEVGTINGYSSSIVEKTRHAVTGISVATSGTYRLSLKMATKHASASAYVGNINHVRLQRTA